MDAIGGCDDNGDGDAGAVEIGLDDACVSVAVLIGVGVIGDCDGMQ